MAEKKRIVREASESRQERIKHRERKVAIRSRSEWLRMAQTVFNQFIRKRDENELCASCGRNHQGQWHAGHYLSVGARPELRFNEYNVHKQCAPCNNHLSGNVVNYRKRLVDKIGQDKLHWLEGHHDPKHYTIDDIKEIISTYKAKIKELTID